MVSLKAVYIPITHLLGENYVKNTDKIAIQ